MSTFEPIEETVVSLEAQEVTAQAELRKPHEMIVMMPKTKRVTLTGRRIYNALLQLSQARLAAMQSMPPADYMFEAPLAALLRTTGSNGEDRTAAKRYLKEMRGLEVDWESTAPGDGVRWRGFSMLSEVVIEVRGGGNWVSWSFPPTIMRALKEPVRWARIDLTMLARLGAYVSVALYEICARYRENPSGLTSRKSVQWWTEALSQGGGSNERREWRKFKSERVKDAIEEINSETDLEIELIEHKSGKAVVEVQFSVRRKKQVALQKLAHFSPVDANIVLRAESLGIREIKLEGLLKEFGEANVRAQIKVLEMRAADSKLTLIDNSYSYLRSLLRNGLPEENEQKTQTLPSKDFASKNIKNVAQSTDTESADAKFKEQRIALIKQQVAALPLPQREEWMQKAIEKLRIRQQYSGVVQRRAAQGDWSHGLLGAIVVQLYAEHVYGKNWQDQSLDNLKAISPGSNAIDKISKTVVNDDV